jgi:hypothetical protein
MRAINTLRQVIIPVEINRRMVDYGLSEGEKAKKLHSWGYITIRKPTSTVRNAVGGWVPARRSDSQKERHGG